MPRSLLVLVLLATACSSLPPPEARPLPEPEAAMLRRIDEALGGGEAAAGAVLREALERYPDSVDAARIRQNLRLARGEGWKVYEDARAAAAAAPGDPAKLYLLGRVIPDREEQARIFRRALALDPSFYFANYGLAVVELERGEKEEALGFARRAVAIRPENRDAKRQLARARAAAGDAAGAMDLYEDLLLDDPGDAATAAAAADLLVRRGEEDEALRLLLDTSRLRPAESDLLVAAWDVMEEGRVSGDALLEAVDAARQVAGKAPSNAGAWLVLGRALLRRGEAAEALAALDRAVAEGARAAALREDRLRAAIGGGAWPRVRELFFAGLPVRVLAEPGNARGAALARLDAALAAAAAEETADSLAEVARALSSCGFEVGAARTARRAFDLAPDRADLRGLAAETAAWRDLMADTRRLLREQYVRFGHDESTSALDEVLGELGARARESFGRDIFTGLPVESFTLVGAVARSDAAGAPPEWSRHGTLFVVGRRKGGPVQATMMRLLGWFPGRRSPEGVFDLAVGEGQTLRSFFEEGKGQIAGFTLPGWIVMNLDVVSRWEEQVRATANGREPGPLWPAPDDFRRRSLWFPGAVRTGLARSYLAAAGDAAGSFASSLAHERGHLLEVKRYLPILPSLPSILALLVRNGFSAASIEAELERDAEANSLRTSPWPRNALLNTMSFLPFRESAPPHSVGYYELLETLVAEIDRHPARYPSVDRRYNILQQLDRLSDAELRTLLKHL